MSWGKISGGRSELRSNLGKFTLVDCANLLVGKYNNPHIVEEGTWPIPKFMEL